MKRFGEKLRWKDQAFSKITRKVENYIVCNKNVNYMHIVKQILLMIISMISTYLHVLRNPVETCK